MDVGTFVTTVGNNEISHRANRLFPNLYVVLLRNYARHVIIGDENA